MKHSRMEHHEPKACIQNHQSSWGFGALRCFQEAPVKCASFHMAPFWSAFAKKLRRILKATLLEALPSQHLCHGPPALSVEYQVPQQVPGERVTFEGLEVTLLPALCVMIQLLLKSYTSYTRRHLALIASSRSATVLKKPILIGCNSLVHEGIC